MLSFYNTALYTRISRDLYINRTHRKQDWNCKLENLNLESEAVVAALRAATTLFPRLDKDYCRLAESGSVDAPTTSSVGTHGSLPRDTGSNAPWFS